MITFTDKKDQQAFIQEAKEVRSNLVRTLNRLPWNNKLRTNTESLLIMYDQMVNHFEAM
jgi:hypothetical protein